MVFFVMGCVVGAVLAALIAAPFWLSWPASMRWLLASQAPDPIAMGVGAITSPLALQEVVLVDVAIAYGRLRIIACEVAGHEQVRSLHLTGEVLAPGTVAALEGWCAAASPLLLWYESDDDVHLFGPHVSVTGLRRVAAASPRDDER